MKHVFLCHASEDQALAEGVQLALVTAGYEVFFDAQTLQAGDDFNGRILAAIRGCDAFVFLATPASLAEGRYTLTELKFIRQRWPSPAGRVLTINAARLAAQALPPYLAAATLLETQGNVAAEARAALDVMLDRQASVEQLTQQVRRGRRGKALWAGLAAGLLVLAAVLGVVAYPRLQLAWLGAHLHLASFNKHWVREGTELRVADDWRLLVVKVDDVKFKNQALYLSLSTPGSAAQQRVLGLDTPKTVVLGDREYLLQVHDFADVERGADQAELSVTLK